MRIAHLNPHASIVGGVEGYLSSVMPRLAAAGHRLSFWHEVPVPVGPTVTDGADIERKFVGQTDYRRAAAQLGEWRPDLIWAHGFQSADWCRMAQQVAPTLYFAHDYRATCISGFKSHRFPSTQPCHRRFGAACLGMYFPRRCGGLNPLTMWQLYRSNSWLWREISRCKGFMVASAHMRDELKTNGIPEQQIAVMRMPVRTAGQGHVRELSPESPVRVLFVGRFESLKGGHHLIQASARIQQQLNTEVKTTLAGDGTSRTEWENLAAEIQRKNPRVRFVFPGWLGQEKLWNALENSNLMVVPSLWPEPHGQVGLEAMSSGLPVVAYALGGMPEWLRDRINGALAPGRPPTVQGLASAVVKCLEDPRIYKEMSIQALASLGPYAWDSHIEQLQSVFDRAATGVQS